ncbi:MAG: hypothetical protein IJW29_09455 [Clostridia bacterium]|nr:hypothetical protein [Clostridia bacterium]MBQ9785717.1 hypothetical protein [Clostridia bacterium]
MALSVYHEQGIFSRDFMKTMSNPPYNFHIKTKPEDFYAEKAERGGAKRKLLTFGAACGIIRLSIRLTWRKRA